MTVNYLIGGNSTLQNELLKLLGDKEAEEIKNVKIKGDDEGVKKDNENDANNTKDEDKVKIENVIKDAILDQKMEEAKYVNSEMSGGANIVGLVENILAGGNLNNAENSNEQVENTNESNNTEQVENSNEIINEPEKKDKEAIVPGDEIIGNILIEGGNNDISGGNSNNLKDVDDVDDGPDDELVEETEPDTIDDHDEDGENELNDDEDENENSENYDTDDADDTDDSDDENEVNDKYIKIISEMRDSNSSNYNNTSLSGGSVESAKRVKILNMFPWILKSSD